ncbi:hypothetical protein J2X12_000611 [Pseudarthrobacter oxydans]|uniref:Glycosyltransferase n=1 Tax=Pseudarthrobacter oxydans TaxID=1671 RepID=A0AAW8N8M8_PSEOX|nr:hypothetical protein [Pseudarthrobacter oxydans]MDR6790961.1 hypothetical protein [Pseudarthrobacter oxydans]MDR7162610.1 hypothetical protein [Pseudarthrobacter oxydans]
MIEEYPPVRNRKAFVFDSDGSNPYSEELVGIFRSNSFSVALIGPADHDLTDRKYSLRPRFRLGGIKALAAEVFTLTRLFFVADVNTPLIVVWARPYQKVALALVAWLKRGSVFYVVHNPEASRWPVGVRKHIETFLITTALPVVHSEGLRVRLSEFGFRNAGVVVHPPYISWQKRINASHLRQVVQDRSLNLLILGRMQADKFKDLDALVSALDQLPMPASLRLLVRPRVSRLPETYNLVLEDLSREEWIDDAELADSLRWADVLVAPYEAVTESGTVQLALTVGLRVVAFSGGALEQSLISSALAESGNYDELRKAIVRVSTSCATTSRWTPESRARDCYHGWVALLEKSSWLTQRKRD